MSINTTETGLSEDSWELLLEHIYDGDCTPFIGAGAASKTLGNAKELANIWAKEYDYPFKNSDDLARVAQFLATRKKESIYPKKSLSKIINNTKMPDFSSLNEPHSKLAALNLPLYITTNYDNYMTEAIKHQNKPCKVDFLRWCKHLEKDKMHSILETKYMPTPDTPLVFHLHGIYENPQSMVLTECDYIDFMINYSRKTDFLPSVILQALSSTSLLFVGYSLNDTNFRILFRNIITSMGADLDYRSVAVQLDPSNVKDGKIEEAREYLDEYFDKQFKMEIDVYWGEASEFLADLHIRWNKYKDEKTNEKF